MPFVNPDPTYLHRANRVQKLHERYYDLRDALRKKDPDARSVNFNNMCMATNAAMATLRLLHHAAEGGAATLSAALGLKDLAHLQFVKDDLLRSGRLFLLLECQFQTDGLLRSILSALGEDRTRQGFFGDVSVADGTWPSVLAAWASSTLSHVRSVHTHNINPANVPAACGGTESSNRPTITSTATTSGIKRCALITLRAAGVNCT